jgi:hypothetical protein
MDKRLELHEILCELVNITEPNGDRHTYFDPPASVKMKYPAIRYARKRIENTYANNSVYGQKNSYELTVIYDNPDSDLVRKVSLLPMCTHDRHYKADNLNHDTFTIYY